MSANGTPGCPAGRAPLTHGLAVGLVCLALATSGVLGVGWGLPDGERLGLVLPVRTPAVTERILTQAGADRDEKLRASLAVPLTGSSAVGRSVSDDPVARARAIRRFLTFSNDWDEHAIIKSLAFMRPSAFDFHPRMFYYGGLAIYPVGAMIRLGMALGWIPRNLDSRAFLERPEAFARLYVAGRLWMLILAVFSVLAVWWASRQAFGDEIGLVTAVVYAASTPLSAWMTLLKPHVGAAGMVALAFGFTVRALRSGRSRDLVAGGVASGLAASLVPTAGVAIVVPAAGALAAVGGRRASARKLLALGAGAFATFVLLNPYYLPNLGTVRDEARYVSGLYTSTFSLQTVNAMITYQLANAHGWLALAMAAVGFAVLPGRHFWLALLVPAVMLAWAGRIFGQGLDPTLVRFLLPVGPFLAMAIASCHAWLARRNRPLAAALLVLVVARSLAVDLFYHGDRISAAGPASSERVAARWIRDHVPTSEPIGISGEPIPRKLPPLDLEGRRVVAAEGSRPGSDYRWYVTSDPAVPAGSMDRAATFVAPGPVALEAVPGDPHSNLDDDLFRHRVAVMGLQVCRPLQLHQIPIYVYRSR